MPQQKATEKPVANEDDLVDELAPGTKLLNGQYTITRYLNSGGFGITYLAKDSLDRNVVIKECFPAAFSRRTKTVVAARSRAHTAELRSVVQLFVKEARSLSKIVHPNIVAVHQVFEENGTAYMALDYVDGLDLQQIVDGQGKMPTPAETVVMTLKLLHAIGFIHANDMLHRDISPDNVLIRADGEPVLIDFGAAREQASESNRAMSALRVVKDGYSPQEFYIAGSEQGPWSDLYALGATFYHLISGEAPVNGQARLAALAEDRADPYVKIDGRFPGYPPGYLAAIDQALSTLPKKRMQSAVEWLSMFTDTRSLSSAVGWIGKSKEAVDGVVDDMIAAEPTATAADTTLSAGEVTLGEPPQFARQLTKQLAPSAESGATAHAGISTVQVVAGIAATLAVIGAGLLFVGGDAAAPVADSPSAVDAAPASLAETAIAPVVVEPAAPASAPAPAPAAVAVAQPVPMPNPEPDATEEASATEEPVESAATVSVPEPAAAQVAAAPVAPAATETAAAEVEIELAAPDTASAAPMLAAPTGTVRANQVSFAVWDIKLPFVEGTRMIDSQRVAIVQSVMPDTDLSIAGPWIDPGVRILSVNGTDVQTAGSVATSVLNVMSVDPDGRARVVVDHASASEERQTGLLTVAARRIVSLGNGINFVVQTVDGQWQTSVTGVTVPSATQLRQGDILYRDQTTGLGLDTPQALETIMATLVEQGVSLTAFSVLRENRIVDAAMQLASE